MMKFLRWMDKQNEFVRMLVTLAALAVLVTLIYIFLQWLLNGTVQW
jgi:hypothetical protein